MDGKTFARVFTLGASNVFGMVVLAWVAGFITVVRESLGSYLDVALIVATIVGLIIGLISLPAVHVLLWPTTLWRSLPFVYGWSLAIVAMSTIIVPGATSALIAFLSVVVMSIVAHTRYRRVDPLRCRECNYDLRGLSDPGCPECGWGRGGAASNGRGE